jgi:predicted GTPase
MPYGAGRFAAEKYGAAEIVDPRPYLHGSLNLVFKKYPHLGKLIPAMGYWPEQIKDLEATINAVPCDTVLIATPMDLRKVVSVEKPAAVSTYGVEDREHPYLSEEIENFIKEVVKGTKADGGGV